MTNTERHRQFYLASAGIRMWYAKRPLPGAAPSPEYEFAGDELLTEPTSPDSAEIAVQEPVKTSPTQERDRSRSVDLQSLMSSPSKAKSEAPDVAIAPAVSEQAPEAFSEPGALSVEPSSHTVISTHLGIWSTEKYLLISQWSDEASERLQDSLAGNLLLALHQKEVGKRQMLHWPVFRNPYIPGNSTDDFQGVLSRLAARNEHGSIILLGVLGDEPDGRRQHCLQSLLPRVGVDFPHSLAELSASPRHKRDLWNALKSSYSV